MGLDMHLSAQKYVGGWDHSDEKEKGQYAAVVKTIIGKPFRCDGSPSLTVTLKVAYWRKANAVHKWFVDNVQGGKDERRETGVEREQLAELVRLCKEVLADPAKAPALLPAQGGFFFGPTDYDDYYLRGLRDTVKQVEPLLSDKTFDGWSFIYRSSW